MDEHPNIVADEAFRNLHRLQRLELCNILLCAHPIALKVGKQCRPRLLVDRVDQDTDDHLEEEKARDDDPEHEKDKDGAVVILDWLLRKANGVGARDYVV